MSVPSSSIRYLFFISLFLGSILPTYAQVNANAGANLTVCTNQVYPIGGSPTASGGTPPYTYLWTPMNGLNNSNLANPTLTPNINTSQYIVRVTDATGQIDYDTLQIFFHPVSYAGAGNDTAVCFGQMVWLGKPSNPTGGGINYSWLPTVGVTNPTSNNPDCTVNVTTTYTVTITSSTCPSKTETVTVTIYQIPNASAGPDVTIEEGGVTTLQGTGGVSYWWNPPATLLYSTTANPDASPTTTTTYQVIVTSAEGCLGYDQVTVFVTPSEKLVFYNTFTPNNDGDNDFFYIANIFKYPDNTLKVYNRFGQLVYQAAPYLNLWDGQNFGDDLPDATYYYIFDDGRGSPLYYGSVTIIR